jgi:SAM-dependent methyltransferase
VPSPDPAGATRDETVDANRSTYDDPRTFQHETAGPHANGWVDAAEQAAVHRFASRARGQRLLDVGIGTGRTVGLLSLLSDDYVGVDYAPRRVDAARQRFPGADLRVADARDLAAFDDGSFDLVFFSFNGIDYASHDERADVLAEFHRLLSADGVLSYSTLNRDGPSHGERPYQLHRPGRRPDLSARNVARKLAVTAGDPARLWRRPSNYRATRNAAREGSEWSTRPLAALDFSLLQHFITLRGLGAELETAGFVPEVIYESEFLDYRPAREVPVGSTTSSAGGFHVVAHRVAAGDRGEGAAT